MDAEKKIKELQELMLKLEEKYKGDFDKVFKDIEKNLNEDDIDKSMSFQPEERPDSLITFLFNSIQNSKESEEDKKKKFEKYAQMIKKLSLEKQERLKQKYKLSKDDKDNFLKKLEALAVKAEKEELQEEDNKSLKIELYKFMPNATEEEQEKAIGLMQSIQEKQRAFLDKCKKDQLKQIEEMKNAEEKEKNKDNTEKTDNAEPSAEPNIEEKVAGSQEDVVEPNVVVPPVESRKKEEEDVSKESDDEKIDFSNRKKISLLKKKKHRAKSFGRSKKSL